MTHVGALDGESIQAPPSTCQPHTQTEVMNETHTLDELAQQLDLIFVLSAEVGKRLSACSGAIGHGSG